MTDINRVHITITYIQVTAEQERDLCSVICDDSNYIEDRFVALRSYMRHCRRAQDEIRGMEYRRMLTTYYWDVIRHYCYRKAGHRCQQCGDAGSKLYTNHRNNDHVGEEYNHLGDLIVLCRQCHCSRHGITKRSLGRRISHDKPLPGKGINGGTGNSSMSCRISRRQPRILITTGKKEVMHEG